MKDGDVLKEKSMHTNRNRKEKEKFVEDFEELLNDDKTSDGLDEEIEQEKSKITS